MAETQAMPAAYPIRQGEPPLRAWLQPHRIALVIIALAVVAAMAATMRWDWLPHYSGALLLGLWRTVWMLAGSIVLGFLLAVPLGLVQVTGPWVLSAPARGFCTLIRGTLPAAEHRLVWDGGDAEGRPVATGLYYYRLSTGESTLNRSMVMLR